MLDPHVALTADKSPNKLNYISGEIKQGLKGL
jgi:hypothetical protein